MLCSRKFITRVIHIQFITLLLHNYTVFCTVVSTETYAMEIMVMHKSINFVKFKFLIIINQVGTFFQVHHNCEFFHFVLTKETMCRLNPN